MPHIRGIVCFPRNVIDTCLFSSLFSKSVLGIYPHKTTKTKTKPATQIHEIQGCRFGPESNTNPGNQHLDLDPYRYQYHLWRLCFRNRMGDRSASSSYTHLPRCQRVANFVERLRVVFGNLLHLKISESLVTGTLGKKHYSP